MKFNFVTVLKILVLSWVLLLSSATTTQAQKPDLEFQTITQEDGLPSNLVYCTLQDHKGFMWLGTAVGLAKYDGYNYTNYYPNPDYTPTTLGTNRVIAMTEDKAGNIWFGTLEGGFGKFDPTTERFKRYEFNKDKPNGLSHNAVRSIFIEQLPDKKEILWLGTGDGLDRFDPATEQFTHYKSNKDDPTTLSSNKVSVFHQDKTGIFWIGTDDGGLNKFDPQTKQ